MIHAIQMRAIYSKDCFKQLLNIGNVVFFTSETLKFEEFFVVAISAFVVFFIFEKSFVRADDVTEDDF